MQPGKCVDDVKRDIDGEAKLHSEASQEDHYRHC